MKTLLTFLIAVVIFTADTKASIPLNITETCIQPEPPLVKVISWGSRGIFLFGGYFNETKDEIIKQVGEAEFAAIQIKCSSSAWPAQMNDIESDEKLVAEKMNKLKMYKVASFLHKYNGQSFEREVILKVPYEENKDWDPEAKWEGSVYFILKEADVEEIK